ncbi:hypothetical protein [Niveispirillum sp. BGYR6]|uniref:hypothetical protein n=1 Tax=Niveispirillum sp. BGYR6 TaxID=2971249 RepID=UPI0022B958AA|nr:hypothetical protein [Niveispirillum sp. BGYR6]MDG5495952.1 hypothetical protein [Niveispirillum sp. BGYR6]
MTNVSFNRKEKFSLSFLPITILSFIITIFFIFQPIFWIFTFKLQSCEVMSENIGPSHNGMQIVMINKLCDGIASSDDMSIAINMPDGSKNVIMDYGTAYSFTKNENEVYPNIVWDNDTSISISIGSVSYLRKKTNSVNGIDIHYNVGIIMFNE